MAEQGGMPLWLSPPLAGEGCPYGSSKEGPLWVCQLAKRDDLWLSPLARRDAPMADPSSREGCPYG